MTKKNQLVLPLVPLPETSQELPAQKLDYNAQMTWALKNGLYAKVKPYLEAMNDVQAQTGKLMFDRGRAAFVAKQHFQDDGNEEMANLSEAKLDHHLNVAARRLHISRRERLRTAMAALTRQVGNETGG